MQIGKQSSNANESIDELLQRAFNKTLLSVIKEEILRLDPQMTPSNPAFKIAVVLMAAYSKATTDIDHLVAFTNYPRPFVNSISGYMQASGLWSGDEVCTDHWFDGEKFTGAFWVDCLVAGGAVVASKKEDGTWTVRRVAELEIAPQDSGPVSQP